MRATRTTDASRMQAAGVTLVSAVRLRPGAEVEHRRLHDAAVAHAHVLGGFIGDELVGAIPGVQPDTVALMRFADRAALDRWLADDERKAKIADMQRLAAGERTLTVLGGFGGWFAEEPRRWKQAVTVIGALVPVAIATATARNLGLPDLPLVLGVALTSAINVAVLTWVLMPVLTSRLDGWLRS